MIVELGQVSEIRERFRSQGRRVVVTNGCFDILHAGHVRYLGQARGLGDLLWVGLNSDASVKLLKGPSRPIHEEADRAEVMDSLKSVEAVTIFPGVRAVDFLSLVKPDIYVKGGDYTVDSLDAGERGVLESCGSKIVILPLVPGRSTTAALKKLAAPEGNE